MSTRLHDVGNNAITKLLIEPRVCTQTVTGSSTGNDFIEGDGAVNVGLFVGTVSGTGGPTLDVVVWETTNGTTFTVCSNGTFTQVTTSTAIQWLSINRTARYLRAIATVGGTTSPSFGAAVVAVQQRKYTP